MLSIATVGRGVSNALYGANITLTNVNCLSATRCYPRMKLISIHSPNFFSTIRKSELFHSVARRRFCSEPPRDSNESFCESRRKPTPPSLIPPDPSRLQSNVFESKNDSFSLPIQKPPSRMKKRFAKVKLHLSPHDPFPLRMPPEETPQQEEEKKKSEEENTSHTRVPLVLSVTGKQKKKSEEQGKERWFAFWVGRRRWTRDDIFAFFSWLLLGTTTWLILGTTTVISLIIFIINVLQKEDYYIEKLGNYLTGAAGLKISFEGKFSSSFREGKLSLHKVTIANINPDAKDTISILLKIDKLSVKISLERWIQGKGLLQTLEGTGIRGYIDLRPLANYTGPWTPNRRTPRAGDFHLEKIQLTDALVNIYLPLPARPLKLRLFHGTANRLRQQWLLLDILSADSIVGEFDGCLFALRSVPQDEERSSNRTAHYRRIHRQAKITGVHHDLIKQSTKGPLSWLDRGTLDILGDLEIWERLSDGALALSSSSELRAAKTVSTQSGSVSAVSSAANGVPAVTPSSHSYFDTHRLDHSDVVDHLESESALVLPDENLFSGHEVHMRFKVLLNNLSASIPLNNGDLTYVQSALVRPIVAYMNANYTQIPLTLDFRQSVRVYDGAWYPQDAELFDELSRSVSTGLQQLVLQHRTSNNIRALLWKGVTGVWRATRHAWFYLSEYIWFLHSF